MRIAIAAAVALIAAPAYAGFFQSVTVDEHGNETSRATVKTPDFVFVPPAKPIFSTTRETRRKNNGDRVTITTTFRNGVKWTKETAVVRGNREGGRGGGGKGKPSGR